MANDIEFYKDIIKYISERIDAINTSIDDKSGLQPYTIALFRRKDNHAFYLTATDTRDESYVRMFKKPNTIKISCYSGDNEKKCEFYRQVQQQGSERQRLTFLFKGSDSSDKSKYLLDKVGVVEKSKYDFEKECYHPLEITENYYNEDPNLVFSKIQDIKEKKKADLAGTLPSPLLEILTDEEISAVSFGFKTTDPYVGNISDDPIASHRVKDHFLELYYMLCTTKLNNQIQHVFKSLSKKFKNYIKEHPELVVDTTQGEDINHTNPGEEDR